ncbi:hypothetical protein, partial [Proteus faecis]|uniref:hypothetical protein n=1 Tax=Proteus faecis TaxID=2050967 RepID=UPI003075CD44
IVSLQVMILNLHYVLFIRCMTDSGLDRFVTRQIRIYFAAIAKNYKKKLNKIKIDFCTTIQKTSS